MPCRRTVICDLLLITIFGLRFLPVFLSTESEPFMKAPAKALVGLAGAPGVFSKVKDDGPTTCTRILAVSASDKPCGQNCAISIIPVTVKIPFGFSMSCPFSRLNLTAIEKIDSVCLRADARHAG